MAKGTGGTADFTAEIDNWLGEIGEDTLLFKQGDSPVDIVRNKYIELWRKQLEAKNHIGASRELYSTLGEGWQIIKKGKSIQIILELPEYYGATDKGRKPTSKTGDGAVYKSLIYQSASFVGWIASKAIKIPTEYTIKRKLKDGTEKTKTYKYISNEFGSAKEKGNRALGFLFARKIHTKGYKGTNWFSDLLPAFEADMSEAIEKQFGDDTDFNIDIITR